MSGDLIPEDRYRAAAAAARVPRSVSYALIGAGLAQGISAGLLLLRLGEEHQLTPAGAKREVTAHLDTYAYVHLATTAAFSLFGALLGHYADELARLASMDVLTGLLNVRAFRRRLHEEIGRASRYGQPLSLLTVDLDGLKRLNDEFGHDAGDEALRRVGAAIRNDLREADVGARTGGDEFAILAPNTNRAEAIIVAERLRGLLADGNASANRRPVTISIGIASFIPTDHTEASERLLRRAADRALYRAKEGGGDRLRVA
jgi:diguanylate cyclase (GGDEF)-like protein